MNDGMRVDFGDGVSALERTTRSIVLMAREAMEQLKDAGYSRDEIEIVPHDEGLPVWISIKGEVVFEIVADEQDGLIFVRGNWLRKVGPKRRSFWDWLLRRK